MMESTLQSSFENLSFDDYEDESFEQESNDDDVAINENDRDDTKNIIQMKVAISSNDAMKEYPLGEYPLGECQLGEYIAKSITMLQQNKKVTLESSSIMDTECPYYVEKVFDLKEKQKKIQQKQTQENHSFDEKEIRFPKSMIDHLVVKNMNLLKTNPLLERTEKQEFSFPAGSLSRYLSSKLNVVQNEKDVLKMKERYERNLLELSPMMVISKLLQEQRKIPR